MIESPEDLRSIEHRLFDIPEQKFLDIVRLLEQVNHRSEVRDTIATIRPRLVRLRPSRRPTLLRLLCVPFEDLLDRGHALDWPIGRIRRAAIAPCWALVRHYADPAELARLETDFAATDGRRRDLWQPIGLALWRLAATALNAALAEPAGHRLPPGASGDRTDQLHDLAHLLAAAPEIEAMKQDLPTPPYTELSDAEIALVQQRAAQAGQRHPELPYYLLLAVAARMANPAQLLNRLASLKMGVDPAQQASIIGRLGSLIVATLAEKSTRLDGAAAQAGGPAAVADMVEHLVGHLTSARSAVDRHHDPALTDRLKQANATIRQVVVDRILDQAHDVIADSVATTGQDDSDDDRVLAAEDHARALRRCARFAAPLGLEAQLGATVRDIGRDLEDRTDAMLRNLGTPAGDSAADAETRLVNAVRMLELILGPGRAETLYQRGAQAIDRAFR